MSDMKESRPFPRVVRNGEGGAIEKTPTVRYTFGQPVLRADGKFVSAIEPPVTEAELPRFTQFITNMSKIPGSERFSFEMKEGALMPDGVMKGRQFFLTFMSPRPDDEDGIRLIGTMLPMYAKHVNAPAPEVKKKR